MANNGLSEFGDRGLSGTFGWDSNEIHRKVWLNNPADQLAPFLNALYGDPSNVTPKRFPSPFDSFYAHSMTFECASDHGGQGDTATPGDFSLLDVFPTIRGGVTIDITFRPLDHQYGLYVNDEGWDFSAQTMSLIGNSFAQDPAHALQWHDGTLCTNLTAIVKIIPKIEFVQRRIWCLNLPPQPIQNFIGCVNAAGISIGAAGNSTTSFWPAGTVLLTGLPTIRRWRFDGLQVFEIGIKLAINMYQDVTESSGTAVDYVTWNRLYRPGSVAGTGFWDKVFIGPVANKINIYREGDLGQITTPF